MAFAVVDDQLAKLGKLSERFMFATPADTREVLWGHAGQGKDPCVLVGLEAAGKKKAKKPAKGTTVVARFPSAHAPVHATVAEMAQRFGEGWRAEGLKPYGRSAAGRVIASPRGSRLLVGSPDGTRVEADNPSSYMLRSVHPKAERALVMTYPEGTVAVLDLTTGETSAPIATEMALAQYVPVTDGTLIATQAKGSDTMEFRDEPLGGALGDVLCSVRLEGGVASIAGGDLIVVRAGKTPYNGELERWPVRADGAKVTCAKDTRLVLPGKRFEGENIFASTIAGVGVLGTGRNPKSYFPVR